MEDQHLLGLIKQFCLESGGVHGYRKIAHGLRDLGERCGKYRSYRQMKQDGLRKQVGYRRRADHYGKSAVVAENRLVDALADRQRTGDRYLQMAMWTESQGASNRAQTKGAVQQP